MPRIGSLIAPAIPPHDSARLGLRGAGADVAATDVSLREVYGVWDGADMSTLLRLLTDVLVTDTRWPQVPWPRPWATAKA